MQNILSMNSFKQQIEDRERVALLLINPEDETSRCAFRSITEATYLSEKSPVFVVDINEVDEIQSHLQVAEIPSLLFFIKGKVVDVVHGCTENEYLNALVHHEFASS